MAEEFPKSLPTLSPTIPPESPASLVIPEANQAKPTYEELLAENQQLRGQLESLKYLATHDDLTDTLNRKGLEFALNHYADSGSSIAFLLVDGLNIKAINHYKGYDAGDTAITGMADILKRGMRATDVVARIGGDEFLVALDVTQRGDKPFTAMQQLGEVQMRVSTETERYKNEHPEFAEVGFEVSVGYAIWEPGMTIETVKAAAEKVMKIHKQDQHEQLGAFRQAVDD